MTDEELRRLARLSEAWLVYDRWEGGELFRGPLLVHDRRGNSVAIVLGVPPNVDVSVELLAKFIANSGDLASEMLALRRRVVELEDERDR